MAVRAPGVKALGGAELRLGRALRPLKQMRPDFLRSELDINATVTAMAETGLPEAVLRPATTRWLDLTVLVDDGVSMLLWQGLAGELRRLLERCGAFRQVRVHGLGTRGPTGPRLRSRPYGASAATLPLSAVLDPAGNTLLLVVSDGVGRSWRDGSMHEALLRAASAGPTAVVHTLPRRLWAGTGIGARSWRVTARRRGAANRSWHIEDPLLPPELAPFDGVPVPVLATDGDVIGTWAQLIGSPGRPRYCRCSPRRRARSPLRHRPVRRVATVRSARGKPCRASVTPRPRTPIASPRTWPPSHRFPYRSCGSSSTRWLRPSTRPTWWRSFSADSCTAPTRWNGRPTSGRSTSRRRPGRFCSVPCRPPN